MSFVKKISTLILAGMLFPAFLTNCPGGGDTGGGTDMTAIGLLALLNQPASTPTTPTPTTMSVRFKNTTGAPETYSFHTSTGTTTCGALKYSFNGGAPVAGGATIAYEKVPGGSYVISWDGGTTCTTGAKNYPNGTSWTITSTATIFIFANP